MIALAVGVCVPSIYSCSGDKSRPAQFHRGHTLLRIQGAQRLKTILLVQLRPWGPRTLLPKRMRDGNGLIQAPGTKNCKRSVHKVCRTSCRPHV